MSQQEDQERSVVRAEQEEGKDVEGHFYRSETQEPQADDDSDEVEAHHHGGRGKA